MPSQGLELNLIQEDGNACQWMEEKKSLDWEARQKNCLNYSTGIKIEGSLIA